MNVKTTAVTVIGLLMILAVGVSSLNNQEERTRTENVTVMAEELEIPWGVEFVDGQILITERPGNLLKMNQSDNTVISEINVEHRGEGGLLGIEKHPDFNDNRLIYLYMTTETRNGLRNRVVRYKLVNQELENATTIIEDIPGAPYHDGGRIEFGPDEKLYITTGDATNGQWAQNTERIAGKILRLNSNGSIPEGNPFKSAIYSYGHRNPQGLAWIGEQLWAAEHGRSGLKSGMDELNKIEKGKNYGWPVIEGDENREGMETPKIHSGPDVTWAPAGAAYKNGSIYFAGLRGSTLYEAKIEKGEVQELEEHLVNKYGRLRAVEISPEGNLYITTSNKDGRGKPREGDDKILKIDPKHLE